MKLVAAMTTKMIIRTGPPDGRIFVSNLPFEMKWQEVKDLFKKEVGEVVYVDLLDDENGKPRGAGVMEFNTAEMAKKAIEKMHRHDYKGRKIVVKEDFDLGLLNSPVGQKPSPTREFLIICKSIHFK